MSQNNAILADLKKGYRVSKKSAARDYDCWNLPARICELREEHDIKRDMVKNGKKVHAEYYLA